MKAHLGQHVAYLLFRLQGWTSIRVQLRRFLPFPLLFFPPCTSISMLFLGGGGGVEFSLGTDSTRALLKRQGVILSPLRSAADVRQRDDGPHDHGVLPPQRQAPAGPAVGCGHIGEPLWQPEGDILARSSRWSDPALRP